jgi:hypothetical protein
LDAARNKSCPTAVCFLYEVEEKLQKQLIVFVLIPILLLTGCGGILSVSFDTTPTPDISQQATVEALEMRIATLEPVFRPLDLNAETDIIRESMLNSHKSWNTVWLDALITQYPQGESGPLVERVQLWVDRPQGSFRVLSGPAEGTPSSLQVGDGLSQERISLPDGKRQTQEMNSSVRDSLWTAPSVVIDRIEAHPLDLEIDSPLASILFSTGFAQQGRNYTAVGMEKVAGRTALVVERTDEGRMTDRFWVDTRTGVILRWQSWGKEPDRQGPPAIEILVTKLEFDLAFPDDLFDLRVGEVPQFAADASARPVSTLVPPDTTFEPGAGELYFVLWTPTGSPELQLMRLPGNCVTGTDPCPAPVLVEGFPNTNFMIEPLIWSPQGDYALLVQLGTLYRYNPQDGEWLALTQFPSIRTPIWSPDGQWIAFVGQDSNEQHDVFVIRPDGSDFQNLTNGQYHGLERSIWVHGWLKDGRILYSVMERISSVLYAHRIGETGAAQVRDSALQRGLVVLAPDGLQAAFTNNTEQGVSLWQTSLTDGIFAVDARRVATFNNASITQAYWTVDGSWLVFQVVSGAMENDIQTAYVIRADGTDLRQIAQGALQFHMTMAGQHHIIIEDPESGRLTVIAFEDGISKVLEVPGLRLDQQMRGISWR